MSSQKNYNIQDKGYASPENKAKYDKLIEDKHNAANEVNRLEAQFKTEVGKGHEYRDLTSDQKKELTARFNEAKANSKEYQEAYKTYKSLSDEITNGNPHLGVPDAPFKKTWHELALKRMIREAAEKGYDRLSWTPGEAQAARYDLSKSVDKISVPMVSNSGYSRSVRIDGKDGTSYKLMVDANGKVEGQLSAGQFTGKHLSDVVGKEMSEKIMKLDRPSEFSGDGLKIGGEGMKGFYDKIIPKALEKISGEKVKYGFYHPKGGTSGNTPEPIPVHYIDMTPALRAKALKGFPLFSSTHFAPAIEAYSNGKKK